MADWFTQLVDSGAAAYTLFSALSLWVTVPVGLSSFNTTGSHSVMITNEPTRVPDQIIAVGITWRQSQLLFPRKPPLTPSNTHKLSYWFA